MSFISRTRLVHIADLVNGVQTLITPDVIGTTTGVVKTVLDAFAMLPAQQRPPDADAWKYILQWEVRSHVLPSIRGVVPNTGRLVFDVDFWETSADQEAQQPPKRRNTFVHEFTAKQLAGSGAIILGEIDDYLLRAEFGNYPADGRDPRVVATREPGQDPLNLLTRQAITSKDGVYRTLPAAWRSAP